MRKTRCGRPDAEDPLRKTRCGRPVAEDPLRKTRCGRPTAEDPLRKTYWSGWSLPYGRPPHHTRKVTLPHTKSPHHKEGGFRTRKTSQGQLKVKGTPPFPGPDTRSQFLVGFRAHAEDLLRKTLKVNQGRIQRGGTHHLGALRHKPGRSLEHKFHIPYIPCSRGHLIPIWLPLGQA